MATARCYTKSGSIEKYESNVWSSPTFENWSSMGIVGTITTPDSNGNYTVTPASDYTDSDKTTKDYCFTVYGGIKKTFYFKKKIIDININITATGYQDYKGYLVFNCKISSNVDFVAGGILASNQIIISYQVVDAAESKILGNYKQRAKFDMTMLEPGIKYSMGSRYYISAQNTKVEPNSGTHAGYEYKISILL